MQRIFCAVVRKVFGEWKLATRMVKRTPHLKNVLFAIFGKQHPSRTEKSSTTSKRTAGWPTHHIMPKMLVVKARAVMSYDDF